MSSGLFKKAAAAAIVLLSLNSLALAEDNACTTATLKGAYGTSIHAQSLGILTGTAPNQVLHPYAAPVIIDAVALPTFDGAGGGSQVDFAMFNGMVRPGSPPDSFASNESLSYSVSSDCTGQLTVTFVNNGNTLTQQIVVVDNGNEIFGVTSSQHLTSGAPAQDGTLCNSTTGGCDIAIQASAHSVRVRQGHEQAH
ncbi:hypothetical protein FAZ95_03310 [Trinickia violacea]|uniref:Uncharacterized protein n=1 Tax=Trinickia violacea TaxID=2571746 RepID=A0A4P8IJD9_9BURK|nr:hypothetical protein [Trinickia violacea]QCP48296.1 hypothetical protein FAZ95_03310 [Trinickia violacea]